MGRTGSKKRSCKITVRSSLADSDRQGHICDIEAPCCQLVARITCLPHVTRTTVADDRSMYGIHGHWNFRWELVFQ